MARSSSVRSVLALIVACVALAAPAGASAATVVNGSFETGDRSGWQTYAEDAASNWYVYEGEEGPFGVSFFSPPDGRFAAMTLQYRPDTTILFQDVTLAAGESHRLSTFLYYSSTEPIVVPEPNTLSASGPGSNQQLRFDIVRPSAPIDSLAPADILLPVFATRTGDSQTMSPTKLSADLTPFAGQTVRLRFATVVIEGPLLAGVDDVSITSPLIPPPPTPSNLISRGKLTLNKKNGTGRLAINVPGPGTLLAIGKGKTKKIKRANLTVTAGGTVQLPLKPTFAGKKALNAKGKLKTRIEVTFAPTGGAPSTQTYRVTLKKALPKPKKASKQG